MRIKKHHLRQARPEDVRRLAGWLKMRDIDTMSHRQLTKLLDWLFKRPEKKRLGLTWNDW